MVVPDWGEVVEGRKADVEQACFVRSERIAR